jgi:hypothetical protein
MNVTRRIAKIAAGSDSLALKVSKLETLALRCYPSSPDQKEVIVDGSK